MPSKIMPPKIVSLATALLAGLILAAAPGASLHRKVPGKKPGPDAALIASGHSLFVSNCSPCHGADAGGDDGPNLHHKSLSDMFVATTIKNGFKNEMPPFSVKLKALEVKSVIAYVHSLQ